MVREEVIFLMHLLNTLTVLLDTHTAYTFIRMKNLKGQLVEIEQKRKQAKA